MTNAQAGALRWDLLEAQPPDGDRLAARLAVPELCDDVFIAVDSSNRRYLLVGIPDFEPCTLSEQISRGIALQTVEMVVDSRPGTFLEVACLEQQGYAALDIVVGEVVEAVSAGASIGRLRVVQGILSKWKRFWSGIPQNVLSKEQQLGLFGELWLLARWLVPSVGSEIAVRMWRGPLGARNDFELPGMAIEVKTTARLDGRHQIHGLEQLLEPPGGALFLFSLSVRDEASGSETLPKLIEEIRGMLETDHSALSQFETTLYASGFEDIHVPEYKKFVLRIREQGLYRVIGDFPRLVPASILGGLPFGVSNLTYELCPDPSSSWLLASSPSAGGTLLADFARLHHPMTSDPSDGSVD